MIYLSLFWAFLKIGLFSFGGAYSAIPLIRDCISQTGWLTDEMLANILAISESTPGPIMVNSATYIGAAQGGVLGAAVATFAVVLPAFVLILILMVCLKALIKKPPVQAVFSGIIPCVVGLILSTGVQLLLKELFTIPAGFSVDWIGLLILALLLGIHCFFKFILHKKLSPIWLILIAAILGTLLYG